MIGLKNHGLESDKPGESKDVAGKTKKTEGRKRTSKRDGGKRRRGGLGAVTFLPSHETTRFDRLASFNQIERTRKLCFLDLNESETDADSPPELPRSSSGSDASSGISR